MNAVVYTCSPGKTSLSAVGPRRRWRGCGRQWVVPTDGDFAGPRSACHVCGCDNFVVELERLAGPVADWLLNNQVEATAERRPYSESADYRPRSKATSWPQLYDLVTLRFGGGAFPSEFRAPFTRGLGHLEPRGNPLPIGHRLCRSVDIVNSVWSLAQCERSGFASEGGRVNVPGGHYLYVPPKLTQVLGCVFQDAGVLEHASYEGWARESGFDPDSRAGEAVYRRCVEAALRLRAACGGRAFEEGLRLEWDTPAAAPREEVAAEAAT